MQKNQEITAQITDYTAEGYGIAKQEGYVLFVPGAVVGDTLRLRTVKCRKNWGYAKIMEIVQPSPCRIAPQCDVSDKCGGCQCWQMTYDAELQFKQQRVMQCLERLGKVENPPMEKILPAPSLTEYRNKAQYPIQSVNGKLSAGFFAAGSHRVVESDSCLIQPAVFNQIVRFVLTYMEQHQIDAYDEQSGSGLVRYLYLRRSRHSGQIMICLVCNGPFTPAEDFCQQISQQFREICSIYLQNNSARNNVILQGDLQLLWGSAYLQDVLCGKTFQISLSAFFQVNSMQTENLYNIVKEYAALQAGDILLDLYCGIGSIGISIAQPSIKLIGIEVVEAAVQDARVNARQNGFSDAEFLCADASKGAQTLLQQGVQPTVIVVDPPRKGLDLYTIKAVVDMAPKRLVYVSCDPATLARDVAVLEKEGYHLQRVKPVDMFPRTGHVETVALLTKR